MKTVRARHDIFLPELGLPLEGSTWVICRDCGVVFQSPRPGPELMNRFYSGGFYHSVQTQKLSEAGLNTKRTQVESQIDWLEEVAGRELSSNRRALELGCGPGVALDVLRQRGWEVRGVEPDGSVAEIGNRKFGLDIVARPFTDELFPKDHFTLVYSHHVYEHLDDPVGITRMVRNVIAPDGLMFIVIPSYPASFNFLPWRWMNVCHNTLFTHKTLGNLLAATGFEMTKHRYTPYGELWALARPVPQSSKPRFRVRWWQEQATLWACPALVAAGRARSAGKRLVTDPRYVLRKLQRAVGGTSG